MQIFTDLGIFMVCKVFHDIVSKGSKKSLTGTMSVKDAAMIVTGKANV